MLQPHKNSLLIGKRRYGSLAKFVAGLDLRQTQIGILVGDVVHGMLHDVATRKPDARMTHFRVSGPLSCHNLLPQERNVLASPSTLVPVAR